MRVGQRPVLCILVVLALAGCAPASAMAATNAAAPAAPPNLGLIERLAQHSPATVAATTARGGAVAGHFTFHRFATRAGHLVALGTFRGRVQDPRLATLTAQAAHPVAIPLNQLGAAAVAPKPLCRVGQIKLNGTLVVELVGIKLTLRSLQLDIQADAGSLLGSILCALVGPSTPAPPAPAPPAPAPPAPPAP